VIGLSFGVDHLAQLDRQRRVLLSAYALQAREVEAVKQDTEMMRALAGRDRGSARRDRKRTIGTT
jgi:hypothetical protein